MFLSLTSNAGDNNKGVYSEFDAGNQAEVEVALLAMKEFFVLNSCGGCAECGHTQEQTGADAEQSDGLERLRKLLCREPVKPCCPEEIGTATERAYYAAQNFEPGEKEKEN